MCVCVCVWCERSMKLFWISLWWWSLLFDCLRQIPDELAEHYLSRSGFHCPDIRVYVPPFFWTFSSWFFLVYLFICYNAWRLSCHWYGFISLGTVVSFELSKFWCTKLCGCYSVRLSCSPTSTNLIYTTKLVNCISKSTMKHQQKSDEIGRPLI